MLCVYRVVLLKIGTGEINSIAMSIDLQCCTEIPHRFIIIIIEFFLCNMWNIHHRYRFFLDDKNISGPTWMK